MDPITISMLAMAAGQAIPALFQGGLGITQGARARNLRKNAVRPTADVPLGFQEAMGVSRNAFYDPNMPGQQYYQDQIAGTQAAGTRGAYQMGGSAAERLMGAALASRGASSGMAKLGATAAQMQQQDAQNYMNMLTKLGDYQRQNWEYNQAQPYAEKMAAAQREAEGSNKNIYGALKGIGGAAVSAAGGLGGLSGGAGGGTGGGGIGAGITPVLNSANIGGNPAGVTLDTGFQGSIPTDSQYTDNTGWDPFAGLGNQLGGRVANPALGGQEASPVGGVPQFGGQDPNEAFMQGLFPSLYPNQQQPVDNTQAFANPALDASYGAYSPMQMPSNFTSPVANRTPGGGMYGSMFNQNPADMAAYFATPQAKPTTPKKLLREITDATSWTPLLNLKGK